MIKTGKCYFYDESGNLWLAISYVDDQGNVTTQDILIEENQEQING